MQISTELQLASVNLIIKLVSTKLVHTKLARAEVAIELASPKPRGRELDRQHAQLLHVSYAS